MKLSELHISWKIVVPVAILVTVLTLCMPRYGEFEYHYRKGAKWNYETLVAPFDFPILKTEEQLNAEKERLGSTYVPYYRYDNSAFAEISLRASSMIDDETVVRSLLSLLNPYYNRGVLPDEQEGLVIAADQVQDVLFVQRDKRAVKTPRQEVYTLHQVRSGIQTVLTLDEDFASSSTDSIIMNSGILDVLVPNLIFDKATTELVHQESSAYISPTSGTFRAGDVIVRSDEFINYDIAQILDSYKAEFEHSVGYNGSSWMLWLSNFLLALVLTSLVVLLLWFSRPDIFDRNYREFLFILCVFMVACVITFIMSRLPALFFLMVPYPVLALYYMAFFRKRLVLSLYTLSLLPILIYAPDSTMLFITFLFGGYIAVYSFSHFNKSWRQFISAFFIFLALAGVYLTFRLMNGSTPYINMMELAMLFLSALFCVFTYPLIYLFEIIFNLVSVSRLVDLSDTNNTLLRDLAQKAPGTFQHSLAVMNMTDAVGRGINADVPLLRTASLYHDIGKSFNPQCFIENQAPGVNYHAELSPAESATEIIRHVTDGVLLAEKHGIPQVVREFILRHHGTTSTGYFYTKYINVGGNPKEAAAFFYPGPKPATKEHVVLMLCDTIEAASRSLNDYSPETISKFVDGIFKSKLDDGQFSEAEISLKELEILRDSIKTYLAQVHHTRVAYPKRKK